MPMPEENKEKNPQFHDHAAWTSDQPESFFLLKVAQTASLIETSTTRSTCMAII
jgi:hypothetical protein